MTTKEELESLRKQKKEIEEQEQIDSEAKRIKEEIENRTAKGKLKNMGKSFIKNLMK